MSIAEVIELPRRQQKQEQPTLMEALREIHKKFAVFKDADNKGRRARIACGEMLIELRRRIEAGEAGEIGWWVWYRQHCVRSRKDAEKVMRMARCEHPELGAEKEDRRQRGKQRGGTTVADETVGASGSNGSTRNKVEQQYAAFLQLDRKQQRSLAAKINAYLKEETP